MKAILEDIKTNQAKPRTNGANIDSLSLITLDQVENGEHLGLA